MQFNSAYYFHCFGRSKGYSFNMLVKNMKQIPLLLEPEMFNSNFIRFHEPHFCLPLPRFVTLNSSVVRAMKRYHAYKGFSYDAYEGQRLVSMHGIASNAAIIRCTQPLPSYVAQSTIRGLERTFVSCAVKKIRALVTGFVWRAVKNKGLGDWLSTAPSPLKKRSYLSFQIFLP